MFKIIRKLVLTSQRGFTLIEMMIVLMIISILLLIAVPNMTKSHDIVGKKSCETTVKLVQSQVAAYQMDKGVLPSSIQDLVDGGYIDSAQCPDGKTLVLGTDGKVSVSE
ncbi:competence type IV pilus major pilin ComGC [Terrilactibacillus laevilacticus]|uniref:ComG operon protein 3 n=1 Tax=Terrilactibacillus laevilacticus TaxID=1380157 RepID=A0ABW5PTW5_9BACI|nr:competence type IV pilus major pilin ComGC [Terrilactibacillus laevilacticus]